MADEQVIPSKDPANDDSLAGVLRHTFRKMIQGIDGQLPAQVVRYDRATNRATVIPLISRLTTSGERLERATIASVPVVALGGGDFYMNFPLKAGDRGWIEASDRDISLFMQGGEMAPPNTVRMHNFSDGRFLPDVMGEYAYDSEDDGKLVISSTDGTVKITLSEDTVKIAAPKLEVIAPGGILLNGPVVMPQGASVANGLQAISGDTGSGQVTFSVPVDMTQGATISGIDFGTHYHDTDDGPSGPPERGK